MATLGLGSMVVQLDLDGADFVRNTKQAQQVLGQTRETVDRASTSFRANRTAARFAAEGISELTGLSGRLIFGFEQMIEKALSARGAFLLLGQAAAVIGGVILVAGIVQAVEEYIRLGETVNQTIDRLKTEGEEQKKFAAARQAVAASARSLAKDQIEAEGELASARAKAAGDEIGGARATLAAKLQSLEFERRQRAEHIIATVTSEQGQSAQLLALEQLTATKRRVLREQSRLAETDLNKKRFVEETNALIENLQTQIKIRQDFDAKVAAAATRQGFGGGALLGLTKVKEFQQDVTTISAGFRDLVARGTPLTTLFPDIDAAGEQLASQMAMLKEQFAGSPTVLAELNRALGAVDFANFTKAIFSESLALRGFEDQTGSVGRGVTALAERLAKDLPAGVEASLPEIQKLTQSIAGLKGWVDATNGAVAALIANLGAAGQAQAAVPIGAPE